MKPEQEAQFEEAGRPAAARSYLALTGTADADPAFVRSLLSAAWARRILYNAAIDLHVPFEAGVHAALARSAAKREGRVEPDWPERSKSFLPVPKPFDLNQALTRLRKRHPELRRWPTTMLRFAIADGCEARDRHVKACGRAKAEGRKLPRLHFRSASDDVDVSTEAARISRCGDGPSVTKPKRSPKVKIEARRRRAEAKTARDDAAWAGRRRAAGMKEHRVQAGLRRRGERRERQRREQAERDRRREVEKTLGNGGPKPRRDSPAAIIGVDRAHVTVQGLGRVRIRLSREVPKGAEVVRLHFVKPAGVGHRIEVRMVVTVPATDVTHDEMVTGAAIHAAVSRLPPDASPLDAVEAVEAAGIRVRGDDWNISAPSADHEGRRTRPVRISKHELKRLDALQAKVARRDAVLLAEAKMNKEAEEAARKTKAQPAVAEYTDRPKTRRAKLARSKSTLKLLVQVRRIASRLADKAETMACQDARRLIEGVALVATDPQGMGLRLMRKGGPAERRERAARALADAQASGLPQAVPPEVLRPPRGYCLTAGQQRAMRRNIHSSRPSFRMRRLNALCTAAGVIHAVPGNAYTSQTCPRCEAVEPKSLGERLHRCARCGLTMHRDQAAALVTLGKALLAYREGPDPGGREAERRAKVVEGLEKAERTRERRVKGGRNKAARMIKAGASLAGGFSDLSLQGVVPLCPGSPGRNIGEKTAARGDRVSN